MRDNGFVKYLMHGEEMKTYRGKPKWGLYISEYLDRNDLDDSNVVVTVLSQHEELKSIYLSIADCRAFISELQTSLEVLEGKISAVKLMDEAEG